MLWKKKGTTKSTPAPADQVQQNSKITPLEWEANRTYLLYASEQRAWRVAILAAIGAILSVVALAIMVPFYRVESVVFLVDKVTGEVARAQMSDFATSQNTIVTKYWLERYVDLRERYLWSLLDTDFDSVSLMSDEKVRAAYQVLYNGPDPLHKKYGQSTEITIKIVSTILAPNGGNTATVRFERTVTSKGQVLEQSAPYIASISFAYRPPKSIQKEKTLIENPMGFVVTGYIVADDSRK